jgi:hypothetical protein
MKKRLARQNYWTLFSVLVVCCVPMASIALELFEEDSMGNVNQRNVGSYKSNKHSRESSTGIVVTQTKPLQAYSTLKLEIPAQLEYYEQGNARVEIEADQETINSITFHYSGSRLTIKSNGFSSGLPVKLKLYGSDLQRVFINSAADVVLNDISVNDFLLSVRGSSDVEVNGKARGCQINTQGASDLDLSRLSCQEVTLAAQGSTDIQLNATKSIKGRVQGAGDVDVYGSPARRKLQAFGAYDINYQ